jgi:multiple antibiotic resistance protein
VNELVRQIVYNTISLITIIDPVAGAATMLSLLPVAATDRRETARIAWRASLTVLIASVATVLFGDVIFEIFGISLMSVQAIGGVVLLLVSIDMIQGKMEPSTRHSAAETEEALAKEDISIIPLGIPMLFGPGLIATLIVFKSSSTSMEQQGVLFLSILISVATVYLALRFAEFIHKILGVTGLRITNRLVGLIVGAIAIQFIVVGVKGLWM